MKKESNNEQLLELLGEQRNKDYDPDSYPPKTYSVGESKGKITLKLFRQDLGHLHLNMSGIQIFKEGVVSCFYGCYQYSQNKPNSFIEIWQGESLVYKTEVIDNSISPEFQPCKIALSTINVEEELKFLVYNKEYSGLLGTHLIITKIGEASIDNITQFCQQVTNRETPFLLGNLILENGNKKFKSKIHFSQAKIEWSEVGQRRESLKVEFNEKNNLFLSPSIGTSVFGANMETGTIPNLWKNAAAALLQQKYTKSIMDEGSVSRSPLMNMAMNGIPMSNSYRKNPLNSFNKASNYSQEIAGQDQGDNHQEYDEDSITSANDLAAQQHFLRQSQSMNQATRSLSGHGIRERTGSLPRRKKPSFDFDGLVQSKSAGYKIKSRGRQNSRDILDYKARILAPIQDKPILAHPMETHSLAPKITEANYSQIQTMNEPAVHHSKSTVNKPKKLSLASNSSSFVDC